MSSRNNLVSSYSSSNEWMKSTIKSEDQYIFVLLSKEWLVLTFFVLLNFPVWCQSNLPVEHLTTKDGLSYRVVNHITKDSEGYMWFSTKDGLNRYDGINWIVFKHRPNDETSISSNIVRKVIEAGEGRFLIELKNERLGERWDFFDEKTQTFSRAKIPEVKRIQQLSDRWFYTATSEVNWQWIYDTKKYRLKNLTTSEFQDFNFQDFGGYGLPIDENGKFWYPSLDPCNETLFYSFKLPGSVPLSDWKRFVTDNHKNIWLTTTKGRVYKFDVANNAIDQDGEFNLDQFTMRIPPYLDDDGALWIPHKFGIAKIRKKHRYFTNYFNDPKGLNRHFGKGIEAYSIVEDSKDTIFSMFDYNGLSMIHPESGKYAKREDYLISNNVDPNLLGTYEMMRATDDGFLWFGERRNKIVRFSPEDKELKIFNIPDSLLVAPEANLVGETTPSLHLGAKGKLWFINPAGQLWSLDRSTFQFSMDKNRNFHRGVIGIVEDGMWICTDETLFKRNDRNETVKAYKLPEAGRNKNQIEIFKVIAYQGKIWLGTRRGLWAFDTSTESFQQFTRADGLPENIIYTIVPHGEDLWMGTHDGLCRFNIRTNEVKNYYESDGLTHNEFNRESALKTRDGQLYFGGMNGINAFYPEALDSLGKLDAARMVWTSSNKLDRTSGTLTSYPVYELNQSYPIEYYYGDKSFTFNFALLSYADPAKNTYSYFLDGYEEDWNFVGNVTYINYPSLPPGAYTLRVKAKDAFGNAGSNELSVPIIVYGPWWNIWWVKLLFAVAVFLMIFGYIRWRTSILESQKKVLEETVRERTAELEKQKERAEHSEKYKEQFLANMSHEIRTPMHAISGMVNILKRNGHPADQDVYLNAMQTSSDNLVVILNDVLDLSKIEKGKLDIETIPVKPTAIIEHVVQLFKFKAEEKGLTLSHHIGENVPAIIMSDPTRLNQVLLNLVGNAIKFTEKGSIDIALSVKNDHLLFCTRDTGAGISPDRVDRVFSAFEQAKTSTSRLYGGTGLGLNISKQLVELLQGRIWVESEENIGSAFFFELPLVVAPSDSIDRNTVTEKQLMAMADSLKGIRILLAEDNEFNQMIAQDDLAFYIDDLKVDVVDNGHFAVEKFKAGDYDLILMDAQMPEMNGLEAAKAIRALELSEGKENRIPIVPMTASLLRSEIANYHDAGMDNYIPKPYKPAELIVPIYEEIMKQAHV